MWTDGGQFGGNPGPGAGVAVFVSDGRVRVIGRPLGVCTNNFAEVSAISAGLNVLSRPCDVVVFTDSEYVQKGVARIRRGSNLKTNLAAWLELRMLLTDKGHKLVSVEHTYGHADDVINNLADAWASWCASNQTHLDHVYRSLEDALQGAPRLGYKKKKNIERSRAFKNRKGRS